MPIPLQLNRCASFMSGIRYLTDERQFYENTLLNGVRCVFVHDPQMYNIGVRLDTKGGFLDEPEGLRGIVAVSRVVALTASGSYPETGSFFDFVHKNKIKSSIQTLLDHNYLAAELPEECLEEYLDRLSDSLQDHCISRDGLECAKRRFAGSNHQGLNNVRLRENQVMFYLLFHFLKQDAVLLRRNDLLEQVQQFVNRTYTPSNMTLILMGSIAIETMEALAHRYFGKLVERCDDLLPISEFFPSVDLEYTKKLRVDHHAVLARMHTISDEKRLKLTFPLPLDIGISAPLYVSYLFSTSQPGSLQYKLKSEGFIKSLSSGHKTYSSQFQLLYVYASLTLKGSQNIGLIMENLMGYAEIIRQISPNYDLFEQAREYFECIRKSDGCLMKLDRFACELRNGSSVPELRFAEIPRNFIPADIQTVASSLILENAVIVATSDENVDCPVLMNTDHFLRFSVENVQLRPRIDGLIEPRLDSLIKTSKQPAVDASGMQKVCDNPLVYQHPIASQFYSEIFIGLKPLEFSRWSLPAQRLYAAILNYKLFLRSMENIVEFKIEASNNFLDIRVKSIPDSAPFAISLLVEFLSSPIGDEFQDKFMQIRHEEGSKTQFSIYGDSKMNRNSNCGHTSWTENLLEVRDVTDFPNQVKGDLVACFSGNTDSHSLMAIISLLQRIHEPNLPSSSTEP